MNRLKLMWCFLLLNIFILPQAFSQNAKVWVTILNDEHVPFYTTDRKLISKDSVFNSYINSLGIFSSSQALPSSRDKLLRKVYELSSNSSQYELESALSNFVNAVSGVYPAPKYDTLQTPNDYNIVPGINNYALNLINAPSAWDITQGDSNVVVAISDQSYNPTHSELAGKYAYINAGTATTTHGNAVSILAAGKTNNNSGLSSIGYNCKLALYLMNYNEVLNAAYAGYKVINMSWSAGCYYNYYAEQVINEAYATGAFLVASAGNGSTCGNPSNYVYPASYDKVFSVTSIGPNDNHMRFPNDTNSTHQHNDKVDISSPGYDVAVNPAEAWFIQGTGTSYAAPIVSGTIGLMLSVNPCLSQKDIDTILRITAVNIDSLNPTYIGKIGAGRLNAQAAVQTAAAWPSQPMTIVSQPLGVVVALGGTAQFTVASSSSLPLFQWQWDSSGVFVNLVNNLTYSGVNTSTLTISNASIALNNQHYRCITKSGYCQAISNPATLIVNSGTLPDDAGPIHGPTTLCFGDTAQFSINPVNFATGYNWTITGNANIINGSNTNTVTVQFFDTAVSISVVPYNTYGSANGTTINVTTIPLPTGSLSGNQIICSGDSAVLTLNVTGQGPWYATINDSIQVYTSSSPIQVVVYPDSSTEYILQELYTVDGCHAYPDYLSSAAIVKVLPVSRDTIQLTLCSSQLPYQWNGMNISSSGYFNDTLINVSGCDSIITLQLTIVNGNPPAAPSTITQTLINNTCYGRIYRYTASITNNAQGYQWLIPFSCGGIPTVVVDSGDINSSRIIRLKYFSNNPAFLTDSIKVRAYNNCGLSPYKSVRLINTLLSPPAAPSSILVTPLVTNICGERKYRYTAPNLPAATANATAATGYLWSFTNPTPLQAQLDSGTWNSKIIVIKYLSNNAALSGDSIFVKYSSACGYSANKALKINVSALNVPVSPASITITPLTTSVCGQRTYRCSMPLMPNATTSNGAASGYLWTFTGHVATYAVIDSGTNTSRTIILKYTDNNATVIGDSLKAQYNSNCGLSNFRAVKFSVPKIDVPLAPASISITLLSNSTCNSKIYRYTMPLLTPGTTTRATAIGYQWSFTGNLAAAAILDSGTMNSRVIRMKYLNNNAAEAGDSVRANYLSSCGNGLIKAVKLPNVALPTLAAPSSLTGATNICPIVGTSISTRYTCSAVTGAVSYLWTLPSGAVIDSGNNGLKIRVRFITAGQVDSIYVQAIGSNGCTGVKKVIHLQTDGCVALKSTIVVNTKGSQLDQPWIMVYPNPTSTCFQLKVKSHQANNVIHARIFDLQGRLIQTFRMKQEDEIMFGADLKPGVYLMQVFDGINEKTIRVVKY